MRCHSCHNDNPPGVSICEWCGTDLAPPKRKTHSESPSSADNGGGGAAVVSGPGEKRRTMYEPSNQSAPIHSSRPPADDFFGNPPPSRPPLRDPEDPFAQSVRPVTPEPPREPAPAPSSEPRRDAWQAAPAATPPARKNRTIIENPSASSNVRRLRGALFCFTSPEDPGSILSLHEGRNSMGRNDDRDVVLDDGRISGEHGFLFIRKDRHTYVDTSSNGSRIDGQIVYGEQVEVRSGSVMEVGGMRIILVIIPPDIVSQ